MRTMKRRSSSKVRKLGRKSKESVAAAAAAVITTSKIATTVKAHALLSGGGGLPPAETLPRSAPASVVSLGIALQGTHLRWIRASRYQFKHNPSVRRP
jgi:hypothetical protein